MITEIYARMLISVRMYREGEVASTKGVKKISEDRAEVGRLLDCKIGTDYGILPESRCG